MNCKQCGFPVTENDQFCKNCGTAVVIPNETEVVNESVNEMVNASNENVNPVVTQEITPQVTNENVGVTPVEVKPEESVPVEQTVPVAPESKQNNAKYILIGVIAIAVIAAVVIVILNRKPKEEPVPQEETKVVVKDYKVNFNNYKMTIPGNLIYEKSGEQLLVGDEKETWIAVLEFGDINFNTLKNKKSTLKPTFEKHGYTCTEAEEKTIGGVEFITLEATSGSEKAIIGYTKINAMHALCITAYNVNGTIDYKIIESLSSLIKSIEYDENAKGMNYNQKIIIDDKFNIDLGENTLTTE